MPSTKVSVDSEWRHCHGTDHQIKPNMTELGWLCCEISDALTRSGSKEDDSKGKYSKIFLLHILLHTWTPECKGRCSQTTPIFATFSWNYTFFFILTQYCGGVSVPGKHFNHATIRSFKPKIVETLCACFFYFFSKFSLVAFCQHSGKRGFSKQMT